MFKKMMCVFGFVDLSQVFQFNIPKSCDYTSIITYIMYLKCIDNNTNKNRTRIKLYTSENVLHSATNMPMENIQSTAHNDRNRKLSFDVCDKAVLV